MKKKKGKKVKTKTDSASSTEDKLTYDQERFCEYYASHDIDLFGNGTKSYIEAYNPSRKNPNWYDIASAAASRLLRNVKIIKRINQLLEDGGFTDENVDRQHLFLINQHYDFRTKMSAISHYNQLKKRLVNRLDLTSGGKPIPLFDNITNKRDAIPNNNSDKKD